MSWKTNRGSTIVDISKGCLCCAISSFEKTLNAFETKSAESAKESTAGANWLLIANVRRGLVIGIPR